LKQIFENKNKLFPDKLNSFSGNKFSFFSQNTFSRLDRLIKMFVAKKD